MRRLVDLERLHQFMRALGERAANPGTVYLTGGATALLIGWRQSTVDVDIKIDPDQDSVFRALPELKEQLDLNIELASPSDFIPELPEWRERSRFIAQQDNLAFYHYDFYAQALAKLERRHDRDIADVTQLAARALIERTRLIDLFDQIEPQLYRYPAIDPRTFRNAITQFVAGGAN